MMHAVASHGAVRLAATSTDMYEMQSHKREPLHQCTSAPAPLHATARIT